MAATFDQISNGRIILNVVTGGDTKELAKDGIFLNHDQRYELTDEFLTIWRSLMQGDEVTFNGRHLKVQGAKLQFPPVQKPYPTLLSPIPHNLIVIKMVGDNTSNGVNFCQLGGRKFDLGG
ncbi:MAG: LLM class flavin-dependent oxidoreductase [Nostoc sp.]|uniref:LLM class flavin-dependent oxidoreductase n=1 Tax=Nostoc sp. TaxID=1180 RepID=UPI002FFBE77C